MPLGIIVNVHGKPGVTERTFTEYMKLQHPLIHPNSPQYAEHRLSFYTGAWAVLGWIELPNREAESVLGEVQYFIKQHQKIIGKG